MKKLAILLVFVFTTVVVTSCKSSKGCGLTGSVETVSVSNTFTA